MQKNLKIHEVEVNQYFITFWCTPYEEMKDYAKEVYTRLPKHIKELQPKDDLSYHHPPLFHPLGANLKRDSRGALYRHFHIVLPEPTGTLEDIRVRQNLIEMVASAFTPTISTESLNPDGLKDNEFIKALEKSKEEYYKVVTKKQ